MSVPAKILLLLLLNYIDNLTTLHFIIKHGEEVEENPLMVFLFNSLGVEWTIIIKNIGITILGTVALLSCNEETEKRYAHIITNSVLAIYSLLCISHVVNLILY